MSGQMKQVLAIIALARFRLAVVPALPHEPIRQVFIFLGLRRTWRRT